MNESAYFKHYSDFLNESPDIIDEATAGVVYLGWFRPASGDGGRSAAQCTALSQWLICRITTTAGVTIREFTNGNCNRFDQVWDDRASITNYHLRNWI